MSKKLLALSIGIGVAAVVALGLSYHFGLFQMGDQKVEMISPTAKSETQLPSNSSKNSKDDIQALADRASGGNYPDDPNQVVESLYYEIAQQARVTGHFDSNIKAHKYLAPEMVQSLLLAEKKMRENTEEDDSYEHPFICGQEAADYGYTESPAKIQEGQATVILKKANWGGDCAAIEFHLNKTSNRWLIDRYRCCVDKEIKSATSN